MPKFANAQAKDGQVNKGKWLIEVNTGFGKNAGNTSFSFTSTNGETAYNARVEGGYFIKERFPQRRITFQH